MPQRNRVICSGTPSMVQSCIVLFGAPTRRANAFHVSSCPGAHSSESSASLRRLRTWRPEAGKAGGRRRRSGESNWLHDFRMLLCFAGYRGEMPTTKHEGGPRLGAEGSISGHAAMPSMRLGRELWSRGGPITAPTDFAGWRMEREGRSVVLRREPGNLQRESGAERMRPALRLRVDARPQPPPRTSACASCLPASIEPGSLAPPMIGA